MLDFHARPSDVKGCTKCIHDSTTGCNVVSKRITCDICVLRETPHKFSLHVIVYQVEWWRFMINYHPRKLLVESLCV